MIPLTIEEAKKTHIDPIGHENRKYVYPDNFLRQPTNEFVKQTIKSHIEDCRKWLDAISDANDISCPHRVSWFAHNAYHAFMILHKIGIQLESYTDGFIDAINKYKKKQQETETESK